MSISAGAGSMQSGDCLVSVSLRQAGEGLAVSVESIVGKSFGVQIAECVHRTLAQLGVTDAAVMIRDKGALDFVISARIETAVRRAEAMKQ